MPRTATSRPMRRWCWPRPPGMKPRDARREDRGRAARRRRMSTKVEVAGPGFINLTLEPAALARRAAPRDPASRRGLRPRRPSATASKVNVEYVSANPTGPMHVGHCRGAVFGDALANLLAFAGFDGHARILHQRRRRAGRRARPLGVSCATARRSARTSARSRTGSIPATISSRSAQALAARVRRRAARQSRRASGCRSCATQPIATMMAMIRERSRRAQHPPRRVLLRALADRGRRTRSRATIEALRAEGPRSTRAGWRRPRAAPTTTGRTASRRCSARPRSATTSTGR